MFSKKDKLDPYSKHKAILRIAARATLRNYPQASAVYATICSFQQSTDLSGLADEVLKKHDTLFLKDPLLEQDVRDVLTLVGLNELTIDVPKARALISVLCVL